MAKMIKKRNPDPSKIKLPFDVQTLNSLLKYILCDYVSGQRLQNLNRLLKNVDILDYAYQTDVYIRLRALIEATKNIVENGYHDPNILYTTVTDDFPDAGPVLLNLGWGKNLLNSSECDYLTKAIDERLQYLEVFKTREEIINLLTKIDGSAYETSYYSLIQKLKDIMANLLMNLQSEELGQGLLKEFSFSDEDAAALLDTINKKAKRPTSILQTGIRQLNAILSPGFQSGRLYTILGGSGKFKSGTLLNLADQIRQFNPQITPYEDGMKKTILFITLENSIEESIERLYDMYSDVNDEFRQDSTEKIIDIFKKEGNFSFDMQNGIDITFIYRGNLQIATSDIYGIVRDLNEKGKKPICIFLDYIKRIESAHPNNGDERVRMSFVSKELKTIAQYFEIPVITAMQLNRDGNSVIDTAIRDSKQDVARFVGSSSIGNAWDIIEDSDWVCLINLEVQRATNQLFLTFKRLKIRGKKSGDCTTEYFNHPFTNDKCIRLAPDVYLDKSLSLVSLGTDLESIEEQEGRLRDERAKKKNEIDHIMLGKQDRINSVLHAISLDNLVA